MFFLMKNAFLFQVLKSLLLVLIILHHVTHWYPDLHHCTKLPAPMTEMVACILRSQHQPPVQMITYTDSSTSQLSGEHNSATEHISNTCTSLNHNNDSPPPIQPITLNHHSMVTRAKAGIYKPKSFVAQSETIIVAKALKNENWRKAMLDKFQALQWNKT